jgi:hypothetical protein
MFQTRGISLNAEDDPYAIICLKPEDCAEESLSNPKSNSKPDENNVSVLKPKV